MKKNTAVYILVALATAGIIVSFSSRPLAAATLQLPKGTEVKLRFATNTEITSKTVSAGIPIMCQLAEPVMIGDKTLVEAGAQATATVTEVKPAGKPGKGGYIRIDFVELSPKGEYKTVGGSAIKLSGYIENQGKGRKILSWLFIFGLFIKGQQGEIDASAVYTVKVADNIILQSE